MGEGVQGRPELVEDDPGEGAHVTTRTDTNAVRLRTLITSYRRLSILMLFIELSIKKGTTHKILHKDLNIRKSMNKNMRQSICEDFLLCIQYTGREWISRVITGDETWILMYDSEICRQREQWIEMSAKLSTKARMSKS